MDTRVGAVIKDTTIWLVVAGGCLAFFALMGWAWTDRLLILALTGVVWVSANAYRRAKAAKSAPNS